MQSCQNTKQASQLQKVSPTAAAMENDGKDLIESRIHLMNQTNFQFTGISYDILEWFPKLCEYIFQHLSGKDLIQASAVNKEWYKLVAESKQMKKLTLVLEYGNDEGKTLNDEAKDILKKSKRKYENIKLYCYSLKRCSFYKDFLAGKAGPWKSVTMVDSYWNYDPSELLKIIEPTVEELSFAVPRYQETFLMKVTSELTFPRLKTLVCDSFKFNIFKYFDRCTSLVKFHWDTKEFESKTTPDILTILHNNHDLKDIHARTDMLPLEHSFKFKLQKLRMGGRHAAFASENLLLAMQELNVFLATQAQTLESLEIDVYVKIPCFELILGSMPRLTSLSIHPWEYDREFDYKQLTLPVNTTIVSLELKGTQNDPRNQTLIRALPSLKHFKCFEIDSMMLKFLAKEVPGVESIQTDEFYVWSLPGEEIFPNIKKFKAVSLNEDMDEPTGDYKFAAMVKKDLKVYKEEAVQWEWMWDGCLSD